MLLYILLLALVIAIPAMGFRAYYLRYKTRERLNFGMSGRDSDIDDVDLAAGDYGLTGNDRFVYYLAEYLSSAQGSLLIFSLGCLIAVIVSTITGKVFTNLIFTALFGGAILFLISKALLRSNKNKRLTLIKEELPNALQMTAAIMESGLGFEAAINHVIKESDLKHPLYFDLSIMSEAMKRGRRRNEALRLWASRTSEQTVSDVAAAMIQADQTGSSLGAVLKLHANTLLRENEAAVMRRAERLPIKMLMPMVFMILPAVMLVAAGPSVNRIIQIFEDIMSKA